ncbi:MAG: chorismate-binding protein [Candidatus Margulisiibacteriota bacterium]
MQVLIEFEKEPLLFKDPIRIISCYTHEKVSDCFDEMEVALAKGYHLAGLLSYEAGYAFEDKLATDKGYDFPLVYMGIYDRPVRRTRSRPQNHVDGKVPLKIITTNISRSDYFKDIDAIRSFIERGDVYQITYCMKFLLEHGADKYALYRGLFDVQPVPYPAYIEADDFSILSLSPELFMKKSGNHIVTKPMKGTWFREGMMNNIFGGYFLEHDPKNRAENVMIADLLRNDLGRIGHDVRAPRLFEVAGYRTLFQMTSTVTASVDRNMRLYDLFKALHPSGSVTGAPKIHAMEIIRGLEREDRRIYTGAIGYITPNKDLMFNVPIRTLLFRGNTGEMGVGGGIVWDSTPNGEWDECMIKARFITGLK